MQQKTEKNLFLSQVIASQFVLLNCLVKLSRSYR